MGAHPRGVASAIYGERGVIDILAWHQKTGSLLVIELKTAVADVNELLGTMDRKQRLAAQVAHERGWNARTVSHLARSWPTPEPTAAGSTPTWRSSAMRFRTGRGPCAAGCGGRAKRSPPSRSGPSDGMRPAPRSQMRGWRHAASRGSGRCAGRPRLGVRPGRSHRRPAVRAWWKRRSRASGRKRSRPWSRRQAGEIQHAVQPATLQPRSTTRVRFDAPIAGEWSIAFNPATEINGSDLDRNYNRGSKGGCTIPLVVIGDDGSYGTGVRAMSRQAGGP